MRKTIVLTFDCSGVLSRLECWTTTRIQGLGLDATLFRSNSNRTFISYGDGNEQNKPFF